MKEFDIYLNRHFTECDIVIYSLPFRECVSARNRVVVKTVPLDAYAAISLGRGGAAMIAQASADELVTNAMAQADFAIRIGAGMSGAVSGVAKTIYESARFCVVPATSKASVARSVDVAGATSVEVACAADGLAAALPLGTAESSFCVAAAAAGDTQIQRALEAQTALRAKTGALRATKQTFVAASADIVVATEAEVSAMRLQALSDMDDVTLQSIDDQSLNDLDMVVL